MRTFSIVVVAGIAAMTFAGASTAQISSDVASAATANSLSALSSALSGSSKNAVRLNAPASDTSIFANAMKSVSSSTPAALKSAAVSADYMNGKLADVPASAKAGDTLFKNALPAGAGVSNALRASNSASTTENAGGMNAFVGVGLQAPADLGNAIRSSKGEIMNQRLGQ